MKSFIVELQRNGIFIELEGNNLSVKSKVSPIPKDLLLKVKENKEKIISYLKDEKASKVIQVVDKVTKQHGVKLTSQQMSLWPLYKMGQSSTYNIPVSYDLHGELDEFQLKKALTEVYGRYDALHSAFVEENEEVLLRTNFDTNWSPEFLTGDEFAVQKAYQWEQRRHFDLTQDCLFIARLVRLSDSHRVLILNFPHIIMDGWSIEQLWRDISDLYHKKEIEPVTIDYLDYLSYQNEQPKQQDYWVERLAEYESIRLHNVGLIDKNEPHIRYTKLKVNEAKALRELAKQHQVSVFSAAMSLFGQALCCYSGQEDVVVSTPYANREQSQLNHLVGYLVSMIPVRYRRNINLPAFQQELHKDFAAANADFNQLLPALNLQSYEGQHPLQQVVFAWQDGVISTPTLSGIEVGRRDTELVTPKFPLMLSMHSISDGLQMKWEFNPSQISSETVACIERLLIELIRNSGEFVVKAPDLNAPQESDETVLLHLQKMVEKYPNSVAIHLGDVDVSYEQLWCTGQKVAAQLQTLGIKPGERVGIMLPRTEDLAFAIIGIVMAGGVYVPLVDGDSSERLQMLITQCHMRFCIKLESDVTIADVELLNIKELIKYENSDYQKVKLTGKNPLYINFSSGTTGEPKGIECVHQGVVRLVKSPNYMKINSNIKMLSAAALTFDAFTFEFWAPLLNGGQLCLMTEKQLDVLHLRYLIKKHGVNTVLLTSALFHALVDNDPTAFEGVEKLLVGGDVVSPVYVKSVYENVQNEISIINVYGPTENTTFTTCYNIPQGWHETDSIPIGTSVSGSDMFILDSIGNLKPQGCIGEIVTTGLGLAKGYLIKEQEENRFITLKQSENIRAYRTGDLGYVDSEGQLRFVGRNDQQVKINGFRLEPEAINSIFSTFEEIKSAETIVYKNAKNKSLVTFIKANANKKIETESLLQKLSSKLSAFLLPSDLMQVEEFPLTANGKLDKEYLINLYNSNRKEDGQLIKDLTAAELGLLKVWATVLERDEHDIHFNFFKAGGNSILLLKLQKLLSKKYNKELSLKVLIENIELKAMSKALEESVKERIGDESFDVFEGMEIPLTSEQNRLWMIEQLGKRNAYNIPLLYPIDDEVTCEVIERAIRKLYNKFPVLKMNFFEHSGSVFQKSQKSNVPELVKVNVEEEQLDSKLRELSQEKINLSVSCSKVYMLQTEEKKYLLVLIHHICMDGRSLEILSKNFHKAMNNEDLGLKDYGFEEYALWQQSEEYENIKQRDLAYWRQRLKGVNFKTEIYTKNNLNNKFEAAYCSHTLEPSLSKGIIEVGKKINITQFSLWMTLFQMMIARLINKDSCIIATPVANRPRNKDIDRVGFFANILYAYFKYEEGESFLECVKRNKNAQLNDLAHQLAPPEQILREIGYDRENGNNSLTEIMFSFEDSGLSKENVLYNHGMNKDAKFDISFFVYKNGAEVSFKVNYRKEMYSQNVIEEMFIAFENLIMGIVDDPEKCVEKIALKRPFQKVAFEPFRKNITILHLIEQQRRKKSKNTAVQCHDEYLTYDELMSQAYTLANELKKNNIKKGDRVLLHLQRKLELPVSLLAIFICGAIYVPLDPNYPEDRKKYIIEDSDAKFAICDEKTLIENSSQCLHIINLNKVDYSQKTAQNFDISIDDIAYIMYTSGTTGTPKGVVIKHEGIASLYNWANQNYSKEEVKLVYAGTSVCFDLSIFELLVTLGLGGTVFIGGNSLSLIDDLKKYPISLINTVPSVMSEIISYQKITETVKVVNLCGEPLSPILSKAIIDQSPNVALYNLYGPTEDTVYSSCFKVDNNNPENITIGTEIPNTYAFIADYLGRELPDCFPGELCLSGSGLSLGYWNNKELTKEKFIEGNIKYYKTGDIAIKMDDNFVFIGRNDSQIKHNGYRVELDEIDALLIRNEEVIQSCTIQMDNNNLSVIVSYVVPSKTALCESELLVLLSEKLPLYMLPERIIFIEKIPLTHSGKLDKKKLRDTYYENQGRSNGLNSNEFVI